MRTPRCSAAENSSPSQEQHRASTAGGLEKDAAPQFGAAARALDSWDARRIFAVLRSSNNAESNHVFDYLRAPFAGIHGENMAKVGGCNELMLCRAVMEPQTAALRALLQQGVSPNSKVESRDSFDGVKPPDGKFSDKRWTTGEWSEKVYLSSNCPHPAIFGLLYDSAYVVRVPAIDWAIANRRWEAARVLRDAGARTSKGTASLVARDVETPQDIVSWTKRQSSFIHLPEIPDCLVFWASFFGRQQ